MKILGRLWLLRIFLGTSVAIIGFLPYPAFSQSRTKIVSGDSTTKTVIAGLYNKSSLHEWLFGKHYRREWSTPVLASSLRLDTVAGGLRPYKESGSRQTKGLRLKDPDDREYVIRSVDKSFGRAIPAIYRGTFIEDLINDQVTLSHPYAAFTVPPMAEAAKIYHANPIMAYIGKQPALKHYNGRYGNYLYLIEQRPDENWETADNFGNAKSIISTDNMLNKLLKDDNKKVDQLLYVRCRLFDMFIGDWSRHEDQWRWAVVKDGDKTLYKPIPRDRDQVYSIFDGVIPQAIINSAQFEHLQSFGNTIKKVEVYGYPSRFLDRRCANEVTLEQWVSIAQDLQRSLTDAVIEDAVRQMPPEVYEISGEKIIANLKSRRGHLVEFATDYYKFLARHVDVVGTHARDHFEVKRLNSDETSVEVFGFKNDGQREDMPRYSRIFKTKETKDIRIYGIGGEDVLNMAGHVKKGIIVRFIGSDNRDSIVDDSWVSNGRHNTHIYDDDYNKFNVTDEAKLHLSHDSEIHKYNYKEFEYHIRGFLPMVYYDNPDRAFVGIGYRFARHIWRKVPYGFDQNIQLRYSLSQNALSLVYKGKFYQMVGKWDIDLFAKYDAARWTNFFGLGNETKRVVDELRYYRLSTNEIIGSVGLSRWVSAHHLVSANVYYQGIEVLKEPGRFVTETYLSNQQYYFQHHMYAGAKANYTFLDVDNKYIPQKGLMFYAGAEYTGNTAERNKTFATFYGLTHAYIPLIKHFSLSLRVGATSVHGTPEFYQYAATGGPMNLRGYVRDRFWGNTAFYNANEIRYIRDVRSRLMNGKVGLLALYDNGRVWLKGENSKTMHHAYGAGVLVAPFNRFHAVATCAQSEDGLIVQFNINTLL
jgi:hypothetical protein